MQTAADQTPPASGTHAELAVPLAELNPMVAELVRELEPQVELPTPSLPLLPRLPGPIATVRAVELVPFGAGKIGAQVDIELSSLGVPWLTTQVSLGARAHLDGDRIRIGLNPADIVKARLQLPRNQLLQAIERAGGKLLRALPRPRLLQVLELIARHIELHGGRIIREKLLRKLGEQPLLTIALPAELPADDARVFTSSTGRPHLRLALHTTLPGATAIASSPTAGERTRFRISAETAMAVANWGISEGHLPRRYDRKLRPRHDGPFRPVFSWWRREPERPLKIHLYKLDGGCAYLRVGLLPSLTIEGKELVATFSERTVESVDGTPALELGVAIGNALRMSVDRSRRAAAAISFRAGDRALAVRAVSARRIEHDFELELELEHLAASAALEERPLGDQRVGDEVDEDPNPCGLAQVAVQK